MTRLDAKESIAASIFDHDWPEPDDRPSEEQCHAIAEIVLEWIGDAVGWDDDE